MDAFSLLQNMAPLSFDSSRLVDVGSIAYCHVDHKHMQALRDTFTKVVQAQFQVTKHPHQLLQGRVYLHLGQGSQPFCSLSGMEMRVISPLW